METPPQYRPTKVQLLNQIFFLFFENFFWDFLELPQ